jgi:AAA domain
MDLDNYDDIKRTKVLIYGPPKSGKTAKVGQLAAAGFTLHWCDLESGIKTLLNPAILAPEFRKNVKVMNFPDHLDYPVAIDAMRSLLKGGVKKFCYMHGISMCPECAKNAGRKWAEPFDIAKMGDKDVLVIDSATQLGSSALAKVIRKARTNDPEYKETWEDYRQQGMYLNEVFGKIQVLNVNVVVISHEIDVEKDEKKEKIVPLGGTRNYSKTVAKYFDEVIYMEIFNKRHVARNSTTWSPNHLTGGRTGVNIDTPGQDLLANIFLGNNTPSTKPNE